MRLAACLGVWLDIIEPCGFPLSDRSLKRVAMDYEAEVDLVRHDSWTAFMAHPGRQDGRLVLFTTRGAQPYIDFAFQPGDTLLFGRESAGVPEDVHNLADARLIIPIRGRSLNVTKTAAMALGEALRQTHGFPAI